MYSKKLFPIFTLIIITLAIFFAIYYPWLSHFNIPISYSGDNLWNIVSFKNIIENHTFLTTNRLGFPFDYSMNDFPTSDWSYLLQTYFFSFFIKDPFLLTNIFYLFSFLLISTISFIVFSKYIKSKYLSLLGAIVFTFLPYHLIRGEDHIFLTAYYCVPLIIFIILNIIEHKILSLKSLITLSIIIGSSGIYYAFFSIALITFTYLISKLNFPSKKLSNYYLLVPIVIIVTIFISIAPNIIYSRKNGKNEIVALRHPAESEYYGLRITQLYMPIHSYGLTYIKNIQSKYYSQGLEGRGEKSEYLGIVGILGFIISIPSAFFLIYSKQHHLLHKLSLVNIFTLLFSTTGGFGTSIAYFISPQIRCYNRISPIIAFICIFSLLYLIDHLFHQIKHTKTKILFYLLTTLLFLISLRDQIPPGNMKTYFTALYNEFYNDRQFVTEIEKLQPENSGVFQLPYKDFPETLPIFKLGDYDLFKGFVQSKNLNWSYATIKGRYSAQTIKTISSYPIQKLIENLSILGFSGIYIDRFGYSDNGQIIEKEISTTIGSKPLISSNQRLVYFNLNEFNKNYLSNFDSEKINQLKSQILFHPPILWKSGCYDPETIGGDHRWCSNLIKLDFYNPSNQPQPYRLQFKVNTGYLEISNLTININNFSDKIEVNTQGALYNHILTLNPGINTLTFKTNTKKLQTPLDSRDLYLNFLDFKLDAINSNF